MKDTCNTKKKLLYQSSDTWFIRINYNSLFLVFRKVIKKIEKVQNYLFSSIHLCCLHYHKLLLWTISYLRSSPFRAWIPWLTTSRAWTLRRPFFVDNRLRTLWNTCIKQKKNERLCLLILEKENLSYVM